MRLSHPSGFSFSCPPWPRSDGQSHGRKEVDHALETATSPANPAPTRWSRLTPHRATEGPYFYSTDRVSFCASCARVAALRLYLADTLRGRNPRAIEGYSRVSLSSKTHQKNRHKSATAIYLRRFTVYTYSREKESPRRCCKQRQGQMQQARERRMHPQ